MGQAPMAKLTIGDLALRAIRFDRSQGFDTRINKISSPNRVYASPTTDGRLTAKDMSATPTSQHTLTAADTAQSAWLASLGSANAYNRWILSSVETHIRGRTLEIGCGSGTFTKHLAVLADHVTAVDIDPAFIEQARDITRGHANVEIKQADVGRSDWHEQFDTVIALEVIEHIEDDRAVLANLFRALAPGGGLILKVPAAPRLYGEIDRAVGHHRRYRSTDLANRVQQAGFGEIAVWHFNAIGVVGWWLNGKLLRRSHPPTDQVRAFDALVPLLRLVEDRWHPPIGLSLFAIASKPVST